MSDVMTELLSLRKLVEQFRNGYTDNMVISGAKAIYNQQTKKTIPWEYLSLVEKEEYLNSSREVLESALATRD